MQKQNTNMASFYRQSICEWVSIPMTKTSKIKFVAIKEINKWEEKKQMLFPETWLAKKLRFCQTRYMFGSGHVKCHCIAAFYGFN